jgi:hypothetical protein
MPLYSKLFGTRTYLCGAMDRAPDGGVFWREKLTPFLNSLGVIVFNPCDKPIEVGCETPELREHRRICKEKGDLEALREAKPIRTTDLRMVDISDFLIVNIDTECHACGTYEELFLANRQKKPVLLHCEQGIKGIPDWLLLGTLPHSMLFGSWQDMQDYLLNLHNGITEDDSGRWVFFDLEKITRDAITGHRKRLKRLDKQTYEADGL